MRRARTRLGADALAAFISAQRAADLAGLARLRRDSEADPLVALLVDAAIAHLKADLQVVDTAEQRLSGVAAQASPQPAEFAADDGPGAIAAH